MLVVRLYALARDLILICPIYRASSFIVLFLVALEKPGKWGTIVGISILKPHMHSVYSETPNSGPPNSGPK